MEYTSLDPDKPSLFELLSAAHLASLLPPTLRYLLTHLTHRHPRYLLRLLNSFDEVYALLAVVVERYYLATFGGSFVENFYGLKRERVVRVRGGEVRRAGRMVPREVGRWVGVRGGRGDRWRNLAVLVGVPYVKRKLDEAYEVHVVPEAALIVAGGGGGGRGGGPRYVDRDALPAHPTWRQRWMWAYKWFLRRVYPSVNAVYYFSILAFSLGYLFDGTKYSSPSLWLVGTRMRRLGEADYRAFALAAEQTTKKPGAAGSRLGWRSLFDRRRLYAQLLGSLKILLPASIFALKFLEWWHASDFSRQLSRKAAEGLELPAPIVSGMMSPRGKQVRGQEIRVEETERKDAQTTRQPKSKPPISSTTHLLILTVPIPPATDLCPICLHPISNPAACQTGYVFDYKCIFQWVEGSHERQLSWMRGEKMSEWEEDDDDEDEDEDDDPEDAVETDSGEREGTGEAERTKRKDAVEEKEEGGGASSGREGRWESGRGRCAITGRRVLGGTGGLRRVMV